MRLAHHRAGDGPPLVLMHGIGMSWEAWQPVLSRLEAEREVIALDLPGFGASPTPPPGTPPGSASLARLVIAFLDELGLSRPHVAGVSLGGLLAIELALRGRAASATALSPAGFHNRREGAFQRASLGATVRLARRIAPAAEGLTRQAWQRRLLMSQFYFHPNRVPAADAALALRALAGATWFEATARAITAAPFTGPARVGVPMRIAWAEHDRLLVRRQSLRALRALPDADLTLLHGCGHVPMYDDPEQVAEVLLHGSSGSG